MIYMLGAAVKLTLCVGPGRAVSSLQHNEQPAGGGGGGGGAGRECRKLRASTGSESSADICRRRLFWEQVGWKLIYSALHTVLCG